MTPNISLIGYFLLIAVVAYMLCMKLSKVSAIWLVLVVSLLGTGIYQIAVYLHLGHRDKFFVIAVTIQLLLSFLVGGIGAGLARYIARNRNPERGS